MLPCRMCVANGQCAILPFGLQGLACGCVGSPAQLRSAMAHLRRLPAFCTLRHCFVSCVDNSASHTMSQCIPLDNTVSSLGHCAVHALWIAEPVRAISVLFRGCTAVAHCTGHSLRPAGHFVRCFS
eukprot:s7180_g2.t1